MLANPLATRAACDAEIVESWLAGMGSQHTRDNFRRTAEVFLSRLQAGLRRSTVEDVREALESITQDMAPSSARQYVLRAKSLLSYAHRLGYTPFNAGTVIKAKSNAAHRGAQLAKRIVSEVDVRLLIRAARTRRDSILFAVLYAGGLRISELVGLTWADVLARDGGKLQLNVMGKGRITRQVLLPASVAGPLLQLRGDAAETAPVFAGRTGAALKARGIQDLIKRTARAAGITVAISPHWLRHAHASHAIDRGATLPEVQATLGHASVATTSGYLHARPDSSSGLLLDLGSVLK
jgi:integrase/recombinase XerD